MTKKTLLLCFAGVLAIQPSIDSKAATEIADIDYQILLEQNPVAQSVIKDFEAQKNSIIGQTKEQFNQAEKLLLKTGDNKDRKDEISEELLNARRKNDLRITQEYLQKKAKIEAYLLEIIEIKNSMDEIAAKHTRRALDVAAEEFNYSENLFADTKSKVTPVAPAAEEEVEVEEGETVVETPVAETEEAAVTTETPAEESTEPATEEPAKEMPPVVQGQW